MKRIFIIAICVLLGAGSAGGCRKAAENAAEKAIEKGSGGHARMDFDEKNKTMTIKTKDGSVITRAEPGGGTKKIEVKDPQGNVMQTYEGNEKSGKVTFKDKDGNVSTYEAGVPITGKDLGIPFYKGATVVNGTRADSAGFGSATQAVLETDDAFDAVKAFYSKAAPRNAFSSDRDGQEGRVALWTWKDEAFQHSITISNQVKQGKVTVTLSKVMLP